MVYSLGFCNHYDEKEIVEIGVKPYLFIQIMSSQNHGFHCFFVCVLRENHSELSVKTWKSQGIRFCESPCKHELVASLSYPGMEGDKAG